METFDRLNQLETRLVAKQWRLWCFGILGIAFLWLLFFAYFSPNRPVCYHDDVDHFYYGSIGSDISSGLPLKVLQVLPTLFPEHLPEGGARDYTAVSYTHLTLPTIYSV